MASINEMQQKRTSPVEACAFKLDAAVRCFLGALLLLVIFACGGCGGENSPQPPAEAPSIVAQPHNCTVMADQRAVFSVTVSGTPPLSYRWSRNGAIIAGATSGSYTTPATVESDNGALYRVTVSNSAGSVDSEAAVLTVNARPVGYITPGLRPEPVPSPEIYSGGNTIYVAAVPTAGDGSFESPLNSIQAGLDLAQPGDTVRVMPGTYLMTTRTTTVRDATADRRISLVAHDPDNRPILERSGGYGGEILLIKHPYFLVDGFVMDGQYTDEHYGQSYPNGEDSYRHILAIPHYGGFFSTEPSREFYRLNYNGDHAIVRNCELKRNRVDGLYIAADNVLVENCEIHHCLRGNYQSKIDAHAVLATHIANLTLRNLDLHHVSGDLIQCDPDIENRARTKLWSNVDVENCRLWTGPLAEDNADFKAGENVGENGIDVKTFELDHNNYEPIFPRPRMTVRNIEAFGWVQNEYMSNRSVFNIKYSVDWVMDGVHVYGSDVAFRLRGELDNENVGYATLTLRNAVVHDNDRAFLAERLIPNLHIYNCTFASHRLMWDHRLTGTYSVGYDPGTYEMKNCLFLGPKPSVEAADASNLSGEVSWFVDAGAGDFRLCPGSPALDAGIAIEEVQHDILWTPRPSGAAWDVGAYEGE